MRRLFGRIRKEMVAVRREVFSDFKLEECDHFDFFIVGGGGGRGDGGIVVRYWKFI